MIKTKFKFIQKRNGALEPFQPEKIFQAILKAAQATQEFGESEALEITKKVLEKATCELSKRIPTVEEIQDIVEDELLESKFKKTAKAYILYREQHKQIRELLSNKNNDLIEAYINKTDWQVRENGNMTFSFQGLNHYLASELSKQYWLYQIYPNEIREAHIEGDFHIHDLGFLSVYCVGWDLYDLLLKGFKGASGKIESTPAKHFSSALGQIVNFFYTLQGEAAGAQAFSNFDTLLAPFIYYDNLTYEEVKQNLQSFLFNMNVPTRVGFQTPFTNITLDLTAPSYFKNQPVIIGGKAQDKSYGEFQEEMNIFNKALMECYLEGDAKKRVFSFPIPTYNITKDFDWDNENLKPMWEAAAKYGIPYFANYINSDMSPEDARSMCCRLRIDNREIIKKGGGLFGSSPLTGSIGVVTINLPRIGYLSKSEDNFFARLDRLLTLAKNSLEIKRKIIEKLTEQDLYPYSKFYLKDVKKRFGFYWKNHFSTIGIIGMNEALLNFKGVSIAEQEGKEFALKTLKYIKSKLLSFQEETGNLYNLEATPAEGTSFRLALIDKKKFPAIICSNEKNFIETGVPFYTNSSQAPVDFYDDIFSLLDNQDDLQAEYTGGTVQHIYIGEKIENIFSLKKFIKTVFQNYKLPYISITPTFSICPNCGYFPGEIQKCKVCENEMEIYSRIVGYIRPLQNWNDGKQEEFKLRKTFKLQ